MPVERDITRGDGSRLSNEIPFWAMDNDFELKLAG
jgi:hypothetical protein